MENTMPKHTLTPNAVRIAAAAALFVAVGISMTANTRNAEAASARTVSGVSEQLVDIVEHGWRGPRHCHWRLRRGHWIYICHRHR